MNHSRSLQIKRHIEMNNLEGLYAEFTKESDQKSFSDTLFELITKKEVKPSTVFHKSCLSESYGYQLLSGKRKPSRNKILQLAFGLDLTYEETNVLLRSAEKSELYLLVKRDAFISFCLYNNFDICKTDSLLIEHHLSCIVK